MPKKKTSQNIYIIYLIKCIFIFLNMIGATCNEICFNSILFKKKTHSTLRIHIALKERQTFVG
jgi:hypothetical protein